MRGIARSRGLVGVVVWGLSCAVGFALAAVEPQRPLAQFSSGVQLIEVYVTVTDRLGEPITNLRQSDFDVYEDDRKQEISTFATGSFPLTVVLGVDRSASMAGAPLRLAKGAAQAFLRALSPTDRSMVVAINSAVDVIAPLSADRAAQARAIEALDPWSTTALYDAIIGALDRLEPEPGRQALVIVSDGTDRYSRASQDDVINRARGGPALIYPIAIGKAPAPLLPELAVLTGGRSFRLRDTKDLQPTLESIARELHHQYLIGYSPSAPIVPGSQEWRSIRVGLKSPRPGWRLRARDGYMTD